MLLSWQHPSFHVHAGEPVLPDDTDRIEHLARHITRVLIRLDAVTPSDATHVVRGEGAVIETSAASSTPLSRSWARLARKIFEVDPLRCPYCGVEMRWCVGVGGGVYA